MMREVEPGELCDRCAHEFRWHLSGLEALRLGSVCRIVEGRPWRGPVSKMPRTRPCFCDGFEPRRAA
ncbi:MAG TPA: hypothetical protein VFT76_00170 [Actinomycetota bacterium]|nr:hypothetical protein [Actinomycetota bacterium]